jgi:4-diphosphocytidyl-2-C-methyl-D-erythritol kinase
VSVGAHITVAAPAKVNLFLHVTGRRGDGYHEIESLFALVDLADSISLTPRADGVIEARAMSRAFPRTRTSRCGRRARSRTPRACLRA